MDVKHRVLDGPARFAAPACMKLSHGVVHCYLKAAACMKLWHGVVHCYLKAADIAPVFSSLGLNDTSDCKHFATPSSFVYKART
jgi:hypothetical protein